MRRKDRPPTSLFADEGQLFIAGNLISSIMVEIRKFGVNLCLAHQHLSQFSTATVDALSIAGTRIVGQLNKRDSQYFSSDFRDLAEPKDLMNLQPRQMVGRVGLEIVRFRTPDLPERPPGSDPNALIEESRRKYCRPASEIRKELGQKGKEWYIEFSPPPGEDGAEEFGEEDLAYDEF